MDNPERETVNIGHTRHRAKTNKTKTQHRKLKTRTPPKPGVNNNTVYKNTDSTKTGEQFMVESVFLYSVIVQTGTWWSPITPPG